MHFPCPMCNPNVRNVPSAHLSIWIFIRCPPRRVNLCFICFLCSSYVFHTFFLRSFLRFHTIPTISVSRKSNHNHQFPYFPTVIPIRLPTVILHTFSYSPFHMFPMVIAYVSAHVVSGACHCSRQLS